MLVQILLMLRLGIPERQGASRISLVMAPWPALISASP
jgi:hypothetical protein